MSLPRPAAPLLLTLLTATPAQPAPEEWDTSGARHLELTAQNAGEKHPVRISPLHPTNLMFNAPLLPGGVEVEDERWVKVAMNEAEGLVTLLPSGELTPDKPVTVTVRFADGAVPERATFQLVAHPTRAEHQVRVYRQPRSCESYQWEAQQQRERAERCEAILEQERTRPEGPRPGNLSDLFDAGLVGGGKSVAVRDTSDSITQLPGETLEVRNAWSYRAALQGQVAVELSVKNTGTQPWAAEGVEGTTLVSAEGVRLRVLRVWQPEPVVPGAQRQLAVVAETPPEQLRGPFRLRLGEAGGARTITVANVMFP